MSGHPPQRRITNASSLLLTPQENEALFCHLGRKCVEVCPQRRMYGADLCEDSTDELKSRPYCKTHQPQN